MGNVSGERVVVDVSKPGVHRFIVSQDSQSDVLRQVKQTWGVLLLIPRHGIFLIDYKTHAPTTPVIGG